MSSKASHTGHGFAFAMTAAGIVAVSTIVASKASLAQMAPAEGTTSIQRDAEQASKMKEPSFQTREERLNAMPLDWNSTTQTREERLNAMPLDWNSTTGTPTPRTLSPAEEEALRKAPPESMQGGAPHPNADEEARKLHPDDWK